MSYLDRVNEWGEPVDEAKTVGELYHMTPVGQVYQMGEEDFVFRSNRHVAVPAYEGQYFISFTRNPNFPPQKSHLLLIEMFSC